MDSIHWHAVNYTATLLVLSSRLIIPSHYGSRHARLQRGLLEPRLQLMAAGPGRVLPQQRLVTPRLLTCSTVA